MAKGSVKTVKAKDKVVDPKTASELVMCVPREVLADSTEKKGLGMFHGFRADYHGYLKTLVHGVISYVPRSKCEEDPALKQIIPYVLFVYHDVEGGTPVVPYVLRYTRSKLSGVPGEPRLRGKHSLGIGGHITKTE